MKKIKATVIILLTAFAAYAQEPSENNFDPFKSRDFLFDVLHIGSTVLFIYIATSFIMNIIKRTLDQKIKHKILDKGTEENIVTKVLQPDKKDNHNLILQWICVLTSIGIGLTLITLFKPYGVHTIAIMAFSVAAGFLVFYLFTKQPDKQ
jgi:uncharacterized membrane protein